MNAPLIVTADPDLRESLLRLSAAAGVSPVALADPVAALPAWSTAPLVLLGPDVAEAVARLGPARRPGVHLVLPSGPPGDEMFRVALAAGAEAVLDVPSAEGWLIEQLIDAGAPRGLGRALAIIGGSGGVGATTLACALAQVAAVDGPAVVVDCDPLGPGVDRVLGLDEAPGHRWDALCSTTGRLSAAALREALPRRGSLAALSWRSGTSATLQAFAVREVLSAARRGHDLVALDLPRTPDALTDELVARTDELLVVVTPTVLGVASAARVLARHRERSAVSVVVRGSGIDARAVGRAVGAPVLAELGDQRGVAESVDLGLGPVRSRRGPLWRACTTVLASPSAPSAASALSAPAAGVDAARTPVLLERAA